MTRNLLALVVVVSGLAFTICDHEAWMVTYTNRTSFDVWVGMSDSCDDLIGPVQPGESREVAEAYKSDIDPPYTFVACDEEDNVVFRETITDPTAEENDLRLSIQ